MMQTDALARTSHLIGSIYEAALDESLWDDVIRENASTITTLRTHLAAASAKAGAKRQADLVRIVLTGPAVLQVFKEPR